MSKSGLSDVQLATVLPLFAVLDLAEKNSPPLYPEILREVGSASKHVWSLTLLPEVTRKAKCM